MIINSVPTSAQVSSIYRYIHHHAILPPTQHFTRLIRHKFIHNFLIYELWSLLKEVQQRGRFVSPPVSQYMTCKNALLLLLFLPIPCCKSFKIMLLLLQHVQHSIPLLPLLPSAATLRNILWPSCTVWCTQKVRIDQGFVASISGRDIHLQKGHPQGRGGGGC
jgi:hypothetical protein